MLHSEFFRDASDKHNTISCDTLMIPPAFDSDVTRIREQAATVATTENEEHLPTP
jgi:hypothetical protein